jgi:desulfoferrodoxin (superoxide reductase-like protein)
MTKQKPSVGRVVHFNTAHGPFAAWVIAVHSDEVVSLSVCNPGGIWHTEIQVSQGIGPGSWTWPPRV